MRCCNAGLKLSQLGSQQGEDSVCNGELSSGDVVIGIYISQDIQCPNGSVMGRGLPLGIYRWQLYRMSRHAEETMVGRNVAELEGADSQTGEQALQGGLGWLAASAGSLRLLTSIFDALPIAIYTTDAEGQIVFCNSSAAALFGGTPRIGSTGWCGSQKLLWPDATPMVSGKCPMSIALRERRAIQGAEDIARRDNGSMARLAIYATPLFDGEMFVGGVNMLVDLGEHDRTNYLEQRLAAIVECSEDAIISKDLDGTIVTWNRAAEKLFGYTAAEAIGRPVMMLIPDDRQQEEEAILDSIRLGRPVARYETLRRRKDGTLIPIALTVSPLRDSSGRIIGASKVARDISDQIKIREHQTLILNELSHRVKNVLAVAGRLVGLSARSAQSPKAMAQAVQERLGAYSRAYELTPHVRRVRRARRCPRDHVAYAPSCDRCPLSGPSRRGRKCPDRGRGHHH
jgi:PAS domain S-box-containing protein